MTADRSFPQRYPGGAGARLLVVALAALLVLVPASAHAQAAPRDAGADTWRPTRVAKWALLAAAVGFGYWAYVENERADDAYESLRRLCATQQDGCTLVDGGYALDRAESLYREANTRDGRARAGLLAGQASLLGSAAFFIVDLRNGGSPDNIPYDPPPRRAMQLRVGLRLPTP